MDNRGYLSSSIKYSLRQSNTRKTSQLAKVLYKFHGNGLAHPEDWRLLLSKERNPLIVKQHDTSDKAWRLVTDLFVERQTTGQAGIDDARMLNGAPLISQTPNNVSDVASRLPLSVGNTRNTTFAETLFGQ
jgi:hypothetical protein